MAAQFEKKQDSERPFDRNDYILAHIKRDGRGLEIGPSYNPITPKSAGWNVKTVDHADADTLRLKYKAWGVDPSRIEDVDYIVADEGLRGAVGNEKFDWIIASHVIEHTPDLVSFLNDCEALLADGGILSLVIPDKRYCFDFYQPITTTGQVLEAFWQKRKRHSLATVFESYAVQALSNGQHTWSKAENLTFSTSLQSALSVTEQYRTHSEYLDVHAWRFIPTSFSLLMHDLQALGLTGMGVLTHANFNVFEFFFSLKKGLINSPYDRVKEHQAVWEQSKAV